MIISKIIPWLLLAFCLNNVNAQIPIGEDESKIKEIVEGKNAKIAHLQDGSKSYVVRDEEYIIFYMLNKKGVCDEVNMKPVNDSILRQTIQGFNNELEKIESRKWRWYERDKILQVELRYPEGGNAVFTFTKE